MQGEIDNIVQRASFCFGDDKLQHYQLAIEKCKVYRLHLKQAIVHCMVFNYYYDDKQDFNLALEEANKAISVDPTYGEVSI